MHQANRFQQAVIVYNPVARGLSRHRPLLERAVQRLSADGVKARLLATEGPNTAGDQTRRAIEEGADLVFAAGGDGTINEVAAGMLGSDVPLAILPGGTANVLAREMRLPIHMARAAETLPGLVQYNVSVGRIAFGGGNRRVFLCMAGIGLDADIVSRVNPGLKVRTGKFSYWVSGFGKFFTPLPEFNVTIDGRTYQAGFALVSRVRNYGGDLEIARHASLLRDDFEVVLFRGRIRARYLCYFAGVGIRQPHRVPGCSILHAKTVECNSTEEVLVQADGELAGSLPAKIEILPQALKMLVPPDYIRREQRFVA